MKTLRLHSRPKTTNKKCKKDGEQSETGQHRTAEPDRSGKTPPQADPVSSLRTPTETSARERLEAEGAGPPPIRNYCISEVEQIADHAERGQSHNQLHADRQVWGHKMAADAPGESAKND